VKVRATKRLQTKLAEKDLTVKDVVIHIGGNNQGFDSVTYEKCATQKRSISHIAMHHEVRYSYPKTKNDVLYVAQIYDKYCSMLKNYSSSRLPETGKPQSGIIRGLGLQLNQLYLIVISYRKKVSKAKIAAAQTKLQGVIAKLAQNNDDDDENNEGEEDEVVDDDDDDENNESKDAMIVDEEEEKEEMGDDDEVEAEVSDIVSPDFLPPNTLLLCKNDLKKLYGPTLVARPQFLLDYINANKQESTSRMY